MRLKQIVWISSISVIFLFLPSMGMRVWEFLSATPWYYTRWFWYALTGWVLFILAKSRIRKRQRLTAPASATDLLFVAKQRLVKGEISLEEFRQIREELKVS